MSIWVVVVANHTINPIALGCWSLCTCCTRSTFTVFPCHTHTLIEIHIKNKIHPNKCGRQGMCIARCGGAHVSYVRLHNMVDFNFMKPKTRNRVCNTESTIHNQTQHLWVDANKFYYLNSCKDSRWTHSNSSSISLSPFGRNMTTNITWLS